MKTNHNNDSGKFSGEIISLFTILLARNIFRRRYMIFWAKTLRNQLMARARRKEQLREGIAVPPVAILSITSQCNLNCKGCYAKALNPVNTKELPLARIDRLFDEATECGTSVMVIAGGEPMMRKDVLHLAAGKRDMIFPVFTNGTLVDEASVNLFKENPNMIPVLSIEGNPVRTDNRRGYGTYSKVMEKAGSLQRNGVFYGLSITLTSGNFKEVMRPAFINQFYEMGCRLFFFVEYVPSSESDTSSCITAAQKKKLAALLDNMRLIFSALFIALPGEEEKYGGCLAAGRGFGHISSTGSLEPCPFAPWSDVNLHNTAYRSALQSVLLKRIRDDHNELGESRGGCALRENREWVESRYAMVT